MPQPSQKGAQSRTLWLLAASRGTHTHTTASLLCPSALRACAKGMGRGAGFVGERCSQAQPSAIRHPRRVRGGDTESRPMECPVSVAVGETVAMTAIRMKNFAVKIFNDKFLE